MCALGTENKLIKGNKLYKLSIYEGMNEKNEQECNDNVMRVNEWNE